MGKVLIVCADCGFRTKDYEPKAWKDAEAEYREHLKICRRDGKA